MKDKKWVLDCLEDSDFVDPDLIDHFSGESNHNYVFESEGEKYVLRRNLQEKGSVNRLKQEAKILNFLENQGIDFVPRSILYDREKQVHITSFVGNRDVSLKDLDNSHLEEWVEKLTRIHSLNFEDYREFCKRNDYSYTRPQSSYQNLQKYGVKRFEDAQKNLEKTAVMNWAKNMLDELEDIVQKDKDGRIGLGHGDIADNTRVGSDGIYFIDWELGGFSYNPETALSYIKIHENLEQDSYKNIKTLYEDKSNISLSEKKLTLSERKTRIFDVIWALQRAGKLKQKNNDEWKHYHELAEERMNLYEERF